MGRRRDCGVAVNERARRSAEKGNANGQYSLGLILRSGSGGVARDLPAAAEMLRRAAAQGHESAAGELRALALEASEAGRRLGGAQALGPAAHQGRLHPLNS